MVESRSKSQHFATVPKHASAVARFSTSGGTGKYCVVCTLVLVFTAASITLSRLLLLFTRTWVWRSSRSSHPAFTCCNKRICGQASDASRDATAATLNNRTICIDQSVSNPENTMVQPLGLRTGTPKTRKGNFLKMSFYLLEVPAVVSGIGTVNPRALESRVFVFVTRGSVTDGSRITTTTAIS